MPNRRANRPANDPIGKFPVHAKLCDRRNIFVAQALTRAWLPSWSSQTKSWWCTGWDASSVFPDLARQLST